MVLDICCARCGRRLKKDNGTGYGPVCLRKVKAEQEQNMSLLDDFEVMDND